MSDSGSQQAEALAAAAQCSPLDQTPAMIGTQCTSTQAFDDARSVEVLPFGVRRSEFGVAAGRGTWDAGPGVVVGMCEEPSK